MPIGLSFSLVALVGLAAFLLPFSLATSNALFGLALAVSLLSGAWWQSARRLWNEERLLFLAIAAYVLLMGVGILWSLNPGWGLHLWAKQWSWALLPLVFLLARYQSFRKALLRGLSLGLALHLPVCLLQASGHPLPLDYPAGSSVQDPTGLLGHIGFGFVYGVWGAWLILKSQSHNGFRKFICWAFSTLSFGMIFLAQGRSGYLVALTIIIVLIWKLWLQNASKNALLIWGLIGLLIAATVVLGPARQRIHNTFLSIQSALSGDLQHAEPRVSLWTAAWRGIREHPWIGVGTGGYPSFASEAARRDSKLDFGSSLSPGHPHQTYLAAWVRWGPMGLALVLILFWAWIRRGMQANWRQSEPPLILFSGLAMAVHGFTATSLDEYFSSMYAVLWLGIGLGAEHPIRGTDV